MGEHTVSASGRSGTKLWSAAVFGRHGSYLLLYTIGLAVAEIETTYVSPMKGITFHVILLFGLLIHATVFYREKVSAVYTALALAPLIRIMALAMPLVQVPPIYWYLVISIPLFAAAYSVVRVAGLKPGEIGLVAGKLPLQISLGLAGIPLGLIEYLILKPAPLAAGPTLDQIWLPSLVLMFSTGFLEELIFRGVMLRAFINNFGSRFAILYISVIFAVAHIIHRSPLDLVFVFVVSIFFSAVVWSSRSILGVTLAHGMTNISLYLIWPFLLHIAK
ncbi:MAG: CPBP family intramembrane glutamic endopeptidase [Eubacteriales bacterium]